MREHREAVRKMQDYIRNIKAWDKENPRIQLEPIGDRGYVELVPVKELREE